MTLSQLYRIAYDAARAALPAEALRLVEEYDRALLTWKSKEAMPPDLEGALRAAEMHPLAGAVVRLQQQAGAAAFDEMKKERVASGNR